MLLAVLVHSAWQCIMKSLSHSAGIGFAKNMEGNLEIMGGLQRIRSQLKGSIQGMPMLLGPSRKGFLGKLTGNLAALHALSLIVMLHCSCMSCFLGPQYKCTGADLVNKSIHMQGHPRAGRHCLHCSCFVALNSSPDGCCCIIPMFDDSVSY